MEVWRAFEHNVVTHSAAHHIMTISHLLGKNGYARVTDVAKSLGISRSSASITLKALKERGYVEEDENKFLTLSEEGRHLSHSIQSKRVILIRFLKDVLRVDAEQAEVDACKIEHLLSSEAGEKLLGFMKFLFSDNPKAEACLKAYWHHEGACDGRTESCPMCDTDCLMDETLNVI